LIEWIVVCPLALFIILAIIESGFWMIAKSAVNYATFEAAREGAMGHADLTIMSTAFKKAVVPFYGGGTTTEEIVQSYTAKVLPDLANSFSTLEIISPTPASIQDFSVMEAGQLQIPNDSLAYRSNGSGLLSGQSIQDANLLKIKVVFGYRLKMPIVRMIVIDLLKLVTTDEQALLMYGDSRVPIVSQATVRMQSATYNQANWKTAYGLM